MGKNNVALLNGISHIFITKMLKVEEITSEDYLELSRYPGLQTVLYFELYYNKVNLEQDNYFVKIVLGSYEGTESLSLRDVILKRDEIDKIFGKDWVITKPDWTDTDYFVVSPKLRFDSDFIVVYGRLMNIFTETYPINYEDYADFKDIYGLIKSINKTRQSKLSEYKKIESSLIENKKAINELINELDEITEHLPSDIRLLIEVE